MGYLKNKGRTLNWHESKKYVDYIKRGGIRQFFNVYNNIPGNRQCLFRYGDEVEYMLVEMDHINKRVSVGLIADEMLKILDDDPDHNWHPEYSNYMIEGTPKGPFKC